MRRLLRLSVVVLTAVAVPAAQGAGVHVSGDANVVRVVADQPAAVGISRAPDGRLQVFYDAPGLSVHALGACSASGGVATCPASVTTADVWLWGMGWSDLTVQPGAAVTVAVFAGAADNRLDLRGAIAAQVLCGAGSDSVQVTDPSRVAGDCEQVNGAPWLPPQFLGTAAPGELDAAPGGLAWIDARGALHVRSSVTAQGRTIRPSALRTFGRLDVGLDRRGRAVAAVAECIRGFCDRWFSVDVRTGRRSALRVKPPAGCGVTAVARWRSRTALGLDCSTQLIVTAGRRVSRFRFPETAPPTSIDLRGNVAVVDFDATNQAAGSPFDEHIWVARDKPRRCRGMLDQALRPAANLGRAALIAGDRVIWSHIDTRSGLNPATWGTSAAVDASCAVASSYFLPGSFDEAATVLGTTLVENAQGGLLSRALLTAPAPLWPSGSPWDWSADAGLQAAITPGSWY